MLTDLEEASFFDLLCSSTKEIVDFNIINSDILQLDWKYNANILPKSTSTSLVTAIFTTCYARLKLYSVMASLGPRLIYCDTDAVLYSGATCSRPEGELEPDYGSDGDRASDIYYHPPQGHFLGELTSELEPGEHIVKWCGLGSKAYGYVSSRNRVKLCCKGITLNHANREIITFDSMSELLLETLNMRQDEEGSTQDVTRKRKLVADNKGIKIDKKGFKVYNYDEKKELSATANKRILLKDALSRLHTEYQTLPFGFQGKI